MPLIIAFIVILYLFSQIGISPEGVLAGGAIIAAVIIASVAVFIVYLLVDQHYLTPRRIKNESRAAEADRKKERDRPLCTGETYASRMRTRLEEHCRSSIIAIARKRFFKDPVHGPSWIDMLSRCVNFDLKPFLSVDEFDIALKMLEEIRSSGAENELTFALYSARLSAEKAMKSEQAIARGDHIKTRLSDGSLVSGLDFEQWCKSALEHQGWMVEETPGSGDQGVDLIGTYRGHRIVFQCKHYSKTVGNAAVQEVISGKIFYGAGLGVVVTSGAGYSPSAVRLADSAGVVLVSGNEIFSIEQKIKWG